MPLSSATQAAGHIGAYGGNVVWTEAVEAEADQVHQHQPAWLAWW
jgi:hypothetical protein